MIPVTISTRVKSCYIKIIKVTLEAKGTIHPNLLPIFYMYKMDGKSEIMWSMYQYER